MLLLSVPSGQADPETECIAPDQPVTLPLILPPPRTHLAEDGNRGSKAPDARYDRATRVLTFLLPVALEDAAGEPMLADVELRCGVDQDALACDEVLVDGVVADRGVD
jgi:hypothetical protein